MPLLLTPRQLRYRSELYLQFSSLTTAGVGLMQACDMLARNPPARSFRQPLLKLLNQLNQGLTFSEALTKLPGWLPEFDIALLRAGEQSGRLEQCFKILAHHYEERAQLVRQMIADLAYPIFIVHFAILIGPFPQLFVTGDVKAYFLGTLKFLVPAYAVIFLLLLACQGRHGEGWRSLMESIGRWIPVLGTARREMAIARLSVALEALIGAGVTIIEAWQLAGAASGSPALRRAIARWVPNLQAGRTPSEAIRASPEFPEVFSSLYATGEISGRLDDTLKRLGVLFQDNASRKMRALAQWIPRLIYIGILLFLGWQVVSFWVGYYDNILKTF